MLHTKFFCFPYHDPGFGTIQVNAAAHLYIDGSLRDIEIEHAYIDHLDILETCAHWREIPLYVDAWKARFYKEAKRLAALHIQCILSNYSLYEYEYNN